mmetsp:Transcript_109894/g.317744  ORF Transcript_109894/g.317744 Transcript_109894/m.317744 type:complete len:205 (-) Transcript_109894:615-1229(-)
MSFASTLREESLDADFPWMLADFEPLLVPPRTLPMYCVRNWETSVDTEPGAEGAAVAARAAVANDSFTSPADKGTGRRITGGGSSGGVARMNFEVLAVVLRKSPPTPPPPVGGNWSRKERPAPRFDEGDSSFAVVAESAATSSLSIVGCLVPPVDAVRPGLKTGRDTGRLEVAVLHGEGDLDGECDGSRRHSAGPFNSRPNLAV